MEETFSIHIQVSEETASTDGIMREIDGGLADLRVAMIRWAIKQGLVPEDPRNA